MRIPTSTPLSCLPRVIHRAGADARTIGLAPQGCHCTRHEPGGPTPTVASYSGARGDYLPPAPPSCIRYQRSPKEAERHPIT